MLLLSHNTSTSEWIEGIHEWIKYDWQIILDSMWCTRCYVICHWFWSPGYAHGLARIGTFSNRSLDIHLCQVGGRSSTWCLIIRIVLTPQHFLEVTRNCKILYMRLFSCRHSILLVENDLIQLLVPSIFSYHEILCPAYSTRISFISTFKTSLENKFC